jgi:hypothetical protein
MKEEERVLALKNEGVLLEEIAKLLGGTLLVVIQPTGDEGQETPHPAKLRPRCGQENGKHT